MIKSDEGSKPSRYAQWRSEGREKKIKELKIKMSAVSEDRKMSFMHRAVWEREAVNTQTYWGIDHMEMLLAVLRIPNS